MERALTRPTGNLEFRRRPTKADAGKPRRLGVGAARTGPIEVVKNARLASPADDPEAMSKMLRGARFVGYLERAFRAETHYQTFILDGDLLHTFANECSIM